MCVERKLSHSGFSRGAKPNQFNAYIRSQVSMATASYITLPPSSCLFLPWLLCNLRAGTEETHEGIQSTALLNCSPNGVLQHAAGFPELSIEADSRSPALALSWRDCQKLTCLAVSNFGFVGFSPYSFHLLCPDFSSPFKALPWLCHYRLVHPRLLTPETPLVPESPQLLPAPVSSLILF